MNNILLFSFVLNSETSLECDDLLPVLNFPLHDYSEDLHEFRHWSVNKYNFFFVAVFSGLNLILVSKKLYLCQNSLLKFHCLSYIYYKKMGKGIHASWRMPKSCCVMKFQQTNDSKGCMLLNNTSKYWSIKLKLL